ncbi:hypothetical protein [Marmot herpesvirus 1]|nr:hypothetical protein [Marmot herpesvirus 1]
MASPKPELPIYNKSPTHEVTEYSHKTETTTHLNSPPMCQLRSKIVPRIQNRGFPSTLDNKVIFTLSCMGSVLITQYRTSTF